MMTDTDKVAADAGATPMCDAGILTVKAPSFYADETIEVLHIDNAREIERDRDRLQRENEELLCNARRLTDSAKDGERMKAITELATYEARMKDTQRAYAKTCSTLEEMLTEKDAEIAALKADLHCAADAMTEKKAEIAALKENAERYIKLRAIALNGDYADLRAIVSSESEILFDLKIDILRDAASANIST